MTNGDRRRALKQLFLSRGLEKQIEVVRLLQARNPDEPWNMSRLTRILRGQRVHLKLFEINALSDVTGVPPGEILRILPVAEKDRLLQLLAAAGLSPSKLSRAG